MRSPFYADFLQHHLPRLLLQALHAAHASSPRSAPCRSPKHDLLRLLLDKMTQRQESLPRQAAVGKSGKAAGRRSADRSAAAAAKENGHAAKENGHAAKENGQMAQAAANGVDHQALCGDGCVLDKMEASGRVW